MTSSRHLRIGILFALIPLSAAASIPSEGKTQEDGVTRKQIIYCCTNHTPPHCGGHEKLKKLVKKHKCDGWKVKR